MKKIVFAGALALSACGGTDAVDTASIVKDGVTIDVHQNADGRSTITLRAGSAATRDLDLVFLGPEVPSGNCQDRIALTTCVSLDDTGTATFTDVCPGTWSLTEATVYPSGTCFVGPAGAAVRGTPTATCDAVPSFDVTAGTENTLNVTCADPENTQLNVGADCTNGC